MGGLVVWFSGFFFFLFDFVLGLRLAISNSALVADAYTHCTMEHSSFSFFFAVYHRLTSILMHYDLIPYTQVQSVRKL